MPERLLNIPAEDIRTYSPLALPFIGDGAYGLLVREKLSVERVRCEAQAAAAERLEPLLTEEELDQLRRGRNAHPGHVPKNADAAVYHRATGLETLFGYLYLKGEIERIRTLFAAAGE